MFSFRTRSPDRDLNTDQARLERLFSLLDEIESEIVRERDGLRKRWQQEVGDASFLLEASSSGDATAAAEKRLAALSTSVMRAESRLALLDRQLASLDKSRRTMKAFPLNPDS